MCTHIQIERFANTIRSIAALILASLILQALSFTRLTWQFPSSSIWADAAGTLPVYVLYAYGSISLLRRRIVGFTLLYAAICLNLIGIAFPHFPLALIKFPLDLSFLGPFARVAPGLVTTALIVVLLSTHYINRGTLRRPHFKLKPICAVIAACSLLGSYGVLKANVERRARELNAQAFIEFQSGNADAANRLWSRVHNRYPLTSTWGLATYNSAHTHASAGRRDEAIAILKELLLSDVNDWDQTNDVMRPYRNYRHRASVLISECYEAIGEYDRSLRYARLAKNRYVYQNWSFTSQLKESRRLNERITRLERLRMQFQGS